ncbi:hypothetical protein FRX31_018192 [Thalictrum thalictroides]|uniref:Uncharacterized protein n=1 Tax=Thalictrum thalictroides TaxID=46969 RepID=A0A7J6W6R3_THATH|nr:hypothetical protein FRX31_018192 [Thalictrum thalictroides]
MDAAYGRGSKLDKRFSTRVLTMSSRGVIRLDFGLISGMVLLSLLSDFIDYTNMLQERMARFRIIVMM